MLKLGMSSTKLNKFNLEILRNLEILCFIDKSNIKNYGEYLIKYLNKFCINKIDRLYKKKQENYPEKLFFSYNVAESLPGKFNYYVPKSKTTPSNFISV